MHRFSSLKVQTKLLCNSETDVTADRHERWASRMGHIPFRSDPDVQARTQAEVIGDSRQEHVSATSVLRESGNAVILHVDPGKRRRRAPGGSRQLPRLASWPA